MNQFSLAAEIVIRLETMRRGLVIIGVPLLSSNGKLLWSDGRAKRSRDFDSIAENPSTDVFCDCTRTVRESNTNPGVTSKVVIVSV